MLVLDAGAFVAVERGSRDLVALIKRERLAARRSPAAAWSPRSGTVVADGRAPWPGSWPVLTWLPSTTGWDGEPACSLPAAARPMPLMPSWWASQPHAATASPQIPATDPHLRKP